MIVRVLVAGGAGVLGQLVARDQKVIATTRPPGKPDLEHVGRRFRLLRQSNLDDAMSATVLAVGRQNLCWRQGLREALT